MKNPEKRMAIALMVLILGLTFVVGTFWVKNNRLNEEISAKNAVMENLFQQNAKMVELVCTYAKVVGGPKPEICLEG